MIPRQVYIWSLVLILTLSSSTSSMGPDWGFYGHRMINKMAVFCLPIDMIRFYKSNIDYISDHAVDPDKRRYATVHEGVRHYIDIDIWGSYPFKEVPRRFDDALLKYAHYHLVNNLTADSTALSLTYGKDSILLESQDFKQVLSRRDYRAFWNAEVMPQYYEESWIVTDSTASQYFDAFPASHHLYIEDHFSHAGILPYHLLSMKYKLTDAFARKDKKAVLRNSSEFGHYIGDAHVPLHTTVNYNGQLTDQVGIHAFWESRIPELFAEDNYDFLVGRAEYIANPSDYFWDIVLKSHSLLDEVLQIEKKLSREFPEDQQYCYDERLGRTIRIQCPEYAAAYEREMGGMVEERMAASVKAIADVWYTCWVDAGQPDLNNLGKVENEVEEPEIDPNVRAKARPHDF